MTTPSPVCPTCAGLFQLNHPAGALTVAHVPNGCALGAAQDATQAADVERLSDPYGPASLDRAPTPTEVTLAAVLGLPAPDAVTIRRVTSTGAVTRRDPV